MIYKVDHITNEVKLSPRVNSKKKVTIHSTGETHGTAQNQRDYLNNSTNVSLTGFHLAVDEKEAIEIIPFEKVAWHAGDGLNGPGNNTSIGIEICERGDRAKTLENAAQLAARVLFQEGLSISDMVRHYDWSGKNCPRILSANNWKEWHNFKRKVLTHLNALEYVPIAKKDHWAKKHFDTLNKNGISVLEERFDDKITRGEVFKLLEEVINKYNPK